MGRTHNITALVDGAIRNVKQMLDEAVPEHGWEKIPAASLDDLRFWLGRTIADAIYYGEED